MVCSFMFICTNKQDLWSGIDNHRGTKGLKLPPWIAKAIEPLKAIEELKETFSTHYEILINMFNLLDKEHEKLKSKHKGLKWICVFVMPKVDVYPLLVI
jgi:hypothetical protein